MNAVYFSAIEEHALEGKRLGRHIEHDPRSRDYPVELPQKISLVAVSHKRHGKIFDQGQLGSCTGNAAAGAINTEPLYHQDIMHLLHEDDAVNLYELATTLDSSPGSYPPDDTGSSGLAVAKAAKMKGYIKRYHHAFGIDAALWALQGAPVITGVNWYEGFDAPNAEGLVEISGQVRGGHEFEVAEYVPNLADPLEALVGADNSWSTSWGRKGRFYFTVRTWAQLLSEQGDVTVLVP